MLRCVDRYVVSYKDILFIIGGFCREGMMGIKDRVCVIEDGGYNVRVLWIFIYFGFFGVVIGYIR